MNPSRKRAEIRKFVKREAKEATRLAREIWQLAEPAFRETGSAQLLADYLASRGFEVDRPIRSVPTAFRARWGRGRPVVGILGEYDALPDCGLKRGTWGHGCSHHLLGVGAAAGAVAVARLLESERKRGRVEYWGCPAEETLAGKVYMARDGAFRGLDACVAWHPGGDNACQGAGGSALDSIVYEFFGRTAHGAWPAGGRSALDAAVLMDVAANYLREHVPDHMRIHCVIRDGGNAPNVVPEYARIWYYTRAKDRDEVADITRRLTRCARGAVLATETRLKVTKLTGVYSRLKNGPMAELVRDNLVLMGAPRPSPADVRAARKAGNRRPEFARGVKQEIGTAQGKGSSDQDNVSWLAPLGSFSVACVPKGTRGHHRETTAQSNQPFAHRGMLRAAEVMAAIAWDLATDAKCLTRIRAEFRKGRNGFRYNPLVPKRQHPPIEEV